MCCFSRSVEHVGATQIFARAVSDERQLLIYSMSLRVSQPLAMILPLPVPPRPADDAVRFIDLSGYPNFFRDLRAAFPPFEEVARAQGGATALAVEKKLTVHRVGDFEASFVPSLDDFARLDERFRLAPEIWAGLPGYADWGFAVFQLSPDKSWLGCARDQTIHPMAFEFPRRDPLALFFPTLHVHDGVHHPRARFDHTLYCQVDGIVAATLPWNRSKEPLGASVDEKQARGVIKSGDFGFAQRLAGDLPNRDLVVKTPAWGFGDVFSVAGDDWKVRLRGTFAHAGDETLADAQPGQRRAWRETALHHLDRVFAALAEGVPAGLHERRAGWQVQPGKCHVEFRPAAALVEPQTVLLAFASPPSAEIRQEIDAELRALLERAL